MMKHYYFFIIFLTWPGLMLQAQISQGGTPPSFSSKSTLKSELSVTFFQPPDLHQLQMEDRRNDSLGKPYRIAYMMPAEICMNYAGKWDTLSTGEIIWRLKINSPGAAGLQLIYNNFHLPAGSKLFLYSEDKKFVIGAFTEQNNHPSRKFATEIVPGETTVLEYVKSTNSDEQPFICISQVGYVYRGMEGIPNTSLLKVGSGSCEVNVRCSPEGDNYTDVRRSVAKIILSGLQCSGTLLNNTAQDFKNLFSTAFHCVTGHESESATWIVYFNYEYSSCSNSSRLMAGNTMTGAEVRAEIPLDNGSDGVLLELNGTIPPNYNVYWAGWDRRDTIVAAGAGIHHPAGDAKKISTIRNYWRTSTWYGTDSTVGARGAHWSVIFSPTTNGYGVTEGGSSGSGIFGPDERFRGQLSGGSSTCSVPTGDNLYGKLSYSWDKFGSAPNVQFKSWLDPRNTGLQKLSGIDHNTQTGAYWSSSPPVINIDSVVRFTDETAFNPRAWYWTFEGGTPATSSIANPEVRYNTPGLYSVSLQVVNDKGTFTKTRTDYVYVKPHPVWLVQNTHFPSPSRGIGGISIVDSLHVWAWAYDGIDPNHPIMDYTRTSNGGTLWVPDSIVLPNLKNYALSNLYALSSNVVYASVFGPNGGGNILRTTNGGSSWEIQTSATFEAPGGFPNFVYFFNSSDGVAMGDPNTAYFEIYTTTNGGNNWTRVPGGNIPGNLSGETGITNMYWAIGDTIWYGTSKGRVYRSVNKGLNWTVASTGLTGTTDVRFRNGKVGYALQSSDTNLPFAVKKTTDGGLTWQNYTIPSNLNEGDLVYVPHSPATWINTSSGSLVGSSYSADDGATFTALDDENAYTCVKFSDVSVGWAGGFNQDATTGGIYKWDRRNNILTSVDDLPGTPGNDQNYLFNIQPNPVNRIMTITSFAPVENDVKVSLVKLDGTLIDHFTFKNNTGIFTGSIDVSSYSAGLYLVILQEGEKVETRKVVVE